MKTNLFATLPWKKFISFSGCNRILNNIISFLILIIVWEITALIIRHLKGAVFPGPLDVFLKLITLFHGGKIYKFSIFSHIAASLLRWAAGYSFAVVTGILTGVFFGLSAPAFRLCMPVIYVLQIIPGLAWIPVALLLFGLDDTSTIFMIYMMGFTPVVINTAGGIRSVPALYVNAAKIMGAGWRTIFFRVLIPSASLSIINGLRIGLAGAWRVLIAAEMIAGAGVGLGFVIIQSRWSLDFEAAFASVVIIAIIGLLIENYIFSVIETNISQKLGIKTRNENRA
ncbi:MAG: ABC transporter permease [Desulfatiglans sp.]|nr:ABC transporter permease [Desulfatiglans sp.]